MIAEVFSVIKLFEVEWLVKGKIVPKNEKIHISLIEDALLISMAHFCRIN